MNTNKDIQELSDDPIEAIMRDIAELEYTGLEDDTLEVTPEDLQLILERHIATRQPAPESSQQGREILPCPCCGGKADYDADFERIGWGAIYCVICGVSAHESSVKASASDRFQSARDAWNRRPYPPADAAPVGAGNQRATAPQLIAEFTAAIDATYPIPDSKHTSVVQRAMNDRIAFRFGWEAARRAAVGAVSLTEPMLRAFAGRHDPYLDGASLSALESIIGDARSIERAPLPEGGA